MPYMLVTELVSKAKGWSKADAPRNIYCILVTELVFQPPIGSLKVLMSRNNPSIELTLPVSHSDMDPRVSRFDGHISTASRSSSKLFGVNTQKKKIWWQILLSDFKLILEYHCHLIQLHRMNLTAQNHANNHRNWWWPTMLQCTQTKIFLYVCAIVENVTFNCSYIISPYHIRKLVFFFISDVERSGFFIWALNT